MKAGGVKIFTVAVLAAVIPLCLSAQSLDLENANTASTDDTNTMLIMTANTNTETNTNAVTNEAMLDETLTNDNATADEVVTDDVEAGILPDSHWYVLKQWWEDVRMAFTFSPEKKAQLEYQFALQRLAEAREMFAQGQPELANTQLQRFENRIQNFEERAARVSGSSDDQSALVGKLKALYTKQQSVLESAYAQAPDEAKNVIIEAMSRSATGLEDVISKVQGNTAANEFMNTVESQVENKGADIQIRLQNMLQQHAGDDEQSDDDTDSDSTNTNTSGNINQAQNHNMAQNQNQIRNQNQVMQQNQKIDTTVDSETGRDE
ncbi:MAG: DUF5667 domain-containing protein [Patescibacteria group bacterium]